MEYLKSMIYLGLVYGTYPQFKTKAKAKTSIGQLLFEFVAYANNNYADDIKD